jgi:hypothetical protein
MVLRVVNESKLLRVVNESKSLIIINQNCYAYLYIYALNADT